jgi:hypothetical protein
MGIRREVDEFARLGRLPREDAPAEIIAVHQAALERISRPVNSDEAKVLMACFPETDEDCYGLAWSLLHLIETAGDSLELPETRPTEPWLAMPWDARARKRARQGP